MGNLKNLKYINLSQNSLQGSFPPEIGLLEKLEAIILYNNSLTGKLGFLCDDNFNFTDEKIVVSG